MLDMDIHVSGNLATYKQVDVPVLPCSSVVYLHVVVVFSLPALTAGWRGCAGAVQGSWHDPPPPVQTPHDVLHKATQLIHREGSQLNPYCRSYTSLPFCSNGSTHACRRSGVEIMGFRMGVSKIAVLASVQSLPLPRPLRGPGVAQ